MLKNFKNKIDTGDRQCSCCREIKPSTDFFRSKKRLDGFSITCKECCKARVRDWKNNNPEAMQVIWRNDRKRKRTLMQKSLPFLTEEEFIKVKQHFNNSCAYCGNEDILYQDHFHSKGKEVESNAIIPACNKCNSSKNDNEFNKWYKEQLFYSSDREETIYRFLYAQKTMDELYK